jgi:hypothetical protein
VDTYIPFITKNIILPFKHLPVAYMVLCWISAFLFELQIDFSLLGSLYFSWLFMRLFLVTKVQSPSQIGDQTPGFALSQFFPERVQSTIDWLCELVYRLFNACKLVDCIQGCIKKRKVIQAKKKAENRKKALQMLKKEIG